MADLIPGITTSNTDYIEAMKQSTDSAKSAPNKGLDQTDFLRLLTTQLQNQDPSEPMDPTAFVTDLTQMSQLEATTNMNSSILSLTSSFQNLQTMQAASLIGKNVQVIGEDFSHTENEISQFRLNSDQPLTDVKVIVSDESGVVTELDVADIASGEKIIDWNGLDNVGVSKESGVYSLTAYGTDENGDLQAIETVVASRVNSVGVNPDGSMTIALASGERVSMESVREISG